MAASSFNPERAAYALAAIEFIGLERAAAKTGLSVRTVYRYKKRLHNDVALQQLVNAKRAQLQQELGGAIVRCAYRILAKLEELVDDAKVDQLRDVVGAAKIVLEQKTVREALGVEHHAGGDSPGPAPPPPAGGNGNGRAEANIH